METIKINVPDGFMLSTTVNKIGYPIDWHKMSDAALTYLLEYGAQRAVNDRTGGKDKTDADKAKIAGETIARLVAPDFVARKVRESSGDPLVPWLRAFMRDQILATKGNENGAKYRALKGDSDARADLLDELFDKQSESAQATIRKHAESARDKFMAEKAATATAAAKLASSLKLTI